MSNSPKVKPQRHHFYLVSGEVTVVKQEGKELTQTSIKLCTMIKSGLPCVNRTQMAHAQKALQVRFYNEFAQEQKELYKVADVFLFGISYLGNMTDAEFAPPVPEAFMEAANQ